MDNTKQILVGKGVFTMIDATNIPTAKLLDILDNAVLKTNEQAKFYIDVKAEYSYRMFFN